MSVKFYSTSHCQQCNEIVQFNRFTCLHFHFAAGVGSGQALGILQGQYYNLFLSGVTFHFHKPNDKHNSRNTGRRVACPSHFSPTTNSLCMQVKPVINLLKQTLVGTGALLVGAVSLFAFAAPVEDFIHSLNQPPSAASSKPSLRCRSSYRCWVWAWLHNFTTTSLHACIILLRRREELLRLPVEVMQDDDLAAAAAEAADGRPVYCRDRYYRALAGGQYCKWDDLLNWSMASSTTVQHRWDMSAVCHFGICLKDNVSRHLVIVRMKFCDELAGCVY